MRRPIETWSPHRFCALQFRCWDEGAVVFNSANGSTHMISLLGVDLLQQLDLSPNQTSNNLLNCLADVFFGMEMNEALEILDDALEQLLRFDLVSRELH